MFSKSANAISAGCLELFPQGKLLVFSSFHFHGNKPEITLDMTLKALVPHATGSEFLSLPFLSASESSNHSAIHQKVITLAGGVFFQWQLGHDSRTGEKLSQLPGDVSSVETWCDAFHTLFQSFCSVSVLNCTICKVNSGHNKNLNPNPVQFTTIYFTATGAFHFF